MNTLHAKRASVALLSTLALAFVFFLLLVLPRPSLARRLPQPGGRVTVALPAEMVDVSVQAHVFAPVLELTGTVDDDAPAWRSFVIDSIVPEQRGQRWRLLTKAASLLAPALDVCLQKAPSWPRRVLNGLAVSARTATDGDAVVVSLSAPVPVLPLLLAGCVVKTNDTTGAVRAATGAYAQLSPQLLTARRAALTQAPLLSSIEFVGATDKADVVAFGEEGPFRTTLFAPFPDIVLLVQSLHARNTHIVGVDATDTAGDVRRLLVQLRPDLLAAAYGQGRGAAFEGLLPPGLAPARPLPTLVGDVKTPALSLAALPANARKVVLLTSSGDALLAGVVERIALILRNGGLATSVRDGSEDTRADDVDLAVVRFRPPTTDPAIGLLTLVFSYPALLQEPKVKTAIADPRLLNNNAAERVAGALSLERALLDSGLVVPLLAAERWFVVDPELRGARVRPDGVLLLDGAYFSGTYDGTSKAGAP